MMLPYTFIDIYTRNTFIINIKYALMAYVMLHTSSLYILHKIIEIIDNDYNYSYYLMSNIYYDYFSY